MRDILYSSASEEWETPLDLFRKLDAEFDFDLDVCATPENAKCQRFFTKEQDGLSQPWTGTVWCNPPYGRGVEKWVRRCLYHSLENGGGTAVMLLPARTDTKWFHRYILFHAEIRFLPGRLKFGKSKNSAPFPSMIIIFRRCG